MGKLDHASELEGNSNESKVKIGIQNTSYLYIYIFFLHITLIILIYTVMTDHVLFKSIYVGLLESGRFCLQYF